MYQQSNGNIFPPTNIPWQYYKAPRFVEDKSIMVYSGDVNDKDTQNTSLPALHVAIISIVGVSIVSITILVRRYWKQKQRSGQTEVVDDNFYYGDEEDEEDYQESAFTDENDYYDT